MSPRVADSTECSFIHFSASRMIIILVFPVNLLSVLDSFQFLVSHPVWLWLNLSSGFDWYVLRFYSCITCLKADQDSSADDAPSASPSFVAPALNLLRLPLSNHITVSGLVLTFTTVEIALYKILWSIGWLIDWNVVAADKSSFGRESEPS